MRRFGYLLDLFQYTAIYIGLMVLVGWLTIEVFAVPQAPWAIWCYAVALAFLVSVSTALWLRMLGVAREDYYHDLFLKRRNERFQKLQQQATKEIWERMLP